MRHSRLGRSTFFAAALTLWASALPAQQNFDTIQIRATPVAGSVYMLTGSGGNIGLSAGDDTGFLVDDQYAPLTDKIRAAVAEITPSPIRFVLNTHWHGDHTGGNENLGEAGSLIVAHDNVRRRMSSEQFMEAFDRTVPPSPPEALPVVTFDGTVTFHLNGDTIHAFHVPRAHTDGDAIVHFRAANVVHMGDTFFNDRYPFIDLSSGGSINGVIDAADRVLTLANDETRIIPGHGDLSNRAELQRYREVLVTIRDRIQQAIEEGRTLDEVRAMEPTAEFDAEWGGGFVSSESFIETVYRSLNEG